MSQLSLPYFQIVNSSDFAPYVQQPRQSLSQLGSLSSQGCGANLLHELLGFLRRCLAQQAPVREALYQVCWLS